MFYIATGSDCLLKIEKCVFRRLIKLIEERERERERWAKKKKRKIRVMYFCVTLRERKRKEGDKLI